MYPLAKNSTSRADGGKLVLCPSIDMVYHIANILIYSNRTYNKISIKGAHNYLLWLHDMDLVTVSTRASH